MFSISSRKHHDKKGKQLDYFDDQGKLRKLLVYSTLSPGEMPSN